MNHRDKNSIGFQGVTTFAKKGLTIRANAEPFKDPYLNAQGRCLVTEHQTFILFNIYAINTGEEIRLHFYKALFDSISRYKARYKKPIVLAGDFNLTISKFDRHFMLRKIDMNQIIRDVTQDCCDKNLIEFLNTLVNSWKQFLKSLKTKRVNKQVTFSQATGRQRERYRLEITSGDKTVKIGELKDSKEAALSQYEHCEVANVALVGELREILTISGFTTKTDIWKRFSDFYGRVLTEETVWKQFCTFLQDYKMVDVHRHLFKKLDFHYTCWRQDKNMRFVNIGGKIDYFVVDEELLKHVDTKELKLYCGCDCEEHKTNFSSCSAGLCAATQNYNFKAAPFEGGGLEQLPTNLMLQHITPPHTGFIYTPPRLSDHVAISVLFNYQPTQMNCKLDATSLETKKSQPHKMQKTLLQFFKKRKLSQNNF